MPIQPVNKLEPPKISLHNQFEWRGPDARLVLFQCHRSSVDYHIAMAKRRPAAALLDRGELSGNNTARNATAGAV